MEPSAHAFCDRVNGASGTVEASHQLFALSQGPTRSPKGRSGIGKTPGFQGNPGGSVEMGGIEPPSSGRPRVLLRAQSANNFSAPGVMQTCYRMGSVD